MTTPLIKTAIPKRRYQLGEFTAIVLGEIDSGDGIEYRHILALIKEGAPKPFFYVSCDRAADMPYGQFRLRAHSAAFSEDLGITPACRDLDAFTAAAVELVRRALTLGDEVLVPLN